MFITLSKVARPVSLDFTKILVLAAYSFDDELEVTPTLVAKLNTWKKNGLQFVDTFKLDKKLFMTILAGLSKGSTAYHDDELDEQIQDFAQDLRVKLKNVLTNELSVERQELALMKDFATVALAAKEETAERATLRIKKNVSYLGDLDLTQSLGTEVGSQGNIVDKLRTVTAKLGGKDIAIDQKIRTKNKGKQVLKDYNKLRSELNAVPRNFITQLVRQSGKQYLPVRTVADALADAGIRHHTLAVGFDGNIDDGLKYYTSEGKLCNGSPSGEIRMNAEYDPIKDQGYVCEFKAPMAQGWTRLYTVEYKARKNVKKFKAVQNFDKVATRLRKKWLTELKQDGISTKNGTCALVAEIVFQTSGRIGSTGNKTDGASTYGIATLLRGHLKAKGRDRILDYPGKKGQQQKHLIQYNTLNSRMVIDHLDTLAKGKIRKDRLITFNNRPITGNALNKYLASIGMPKGITVHKFRTLKGTKLARQILEASPFLKRTNKPNANAVNKWVDSALMKVAKELGHFANGKLTIATAIANYIDPSVLEDFYTRVGIRMPAKIEKQVNLLK